MLSGKEQRAIQFMINVEDKKGQYNLYTDAMTSLESLSIDFALRDYPLTRAEYYNIQVAIEIIIRIRCKIENKGWWYRAKARPAIFKEYFMNDYGLE